MLSGAFGLVIGLFSGLISFVPFVGALLGAHLRRGFDGNVDGLVRQAEKLAR